MLSEEQWEELHLAARTAQENAYCPYSNFAVGAACITQAGQIYVGANSENAAYGVVLCAECGMISSLTLAGGGRGKDLIVGFLCYGNQVGRTPALTVPCGRCRQIIREHAHPQMEVETPAGRGLFSDILPQSFGPEDLD